MQLAANPLTNIATVKEGANGAVSSASDANTNARGNGPGGTIEVPALGDAMLALLAMTLLGLGMRRAAATRAGRR